MSAQSATTAAFRRYWAHVKGHVVSGWELAVAWDQSGTPTRWRALDTANQEDGLLLWDVGLTRPTPGRMVP